MTLFGQVLIGPPGSGKTTFVYGMHQMCTALNRPNIIVNLDPANENIPYIPDVDVRELINFEKIMFECRLGPNGALVYCMEYLQANIDWLIDGIRTKRKNASYILIDVPGQVELYTHNYVLKEILSELAKELDIRLTAVHLIDSTLLSSPTNYISALLVSLSAQMSVELPYLNVFSKIDLLEHFKDDLPFKLEYFSQLEDLNQLLTFWKHESNMGDHPLFLKYKGFQSELVDLVEDSSIMQFIPVDINDKDSVLQILQLIDKSNGFSMLSEYSEYSALGIETNINMLPNEEMYGTIYERYIEKYPENQNQKEK
ncbi:XPA1 binding GTPase [Cryptosporidium ubiquitum]|uniref:GPN-loop GTPase 2 n=1 Tax=Cryptosporidium ubiquitum TaxID=857276 RepID=A0A1J4MIM7_9CRYT|nr:XPA1 binding GTPase [Cryptosporidium ubiquitum]OII73879.1 XPA1 binding GTPase [Cryptosporidium ubiquitum]